MQCIPPPPIYPEPDDVGADAHDEPGEQSQLASPPPRRFPLNSTHVAYARDARRALLECFGADATAPERLLIDLIAHEIPIHLTLAESEAQLAARLEQMLLRDDVKSVATLARALRQVAAVTHAVGRRVETVLSTAVALKAQRRLVELHRQGAGK